MNSVPTGSFSRFMWSHDNRYLLRLIRIDISCKREVVAIAHYSYLLEIEKHAGYIVATINLFGRSWLANIGKRQFYVQRIHQEAE